VMSEEEKQARHMVKRGTPWARQNWSYFLATIGSCQIEHNLLLGSLIHKDVDPHLSLVRTK
jgi:hypothetical protein